MSLSLPSRSRSAGASLTVVCGLLSGLFIAVPALAEVFTGETAVTSYLLGLAPALSLPLLGALHRRQSPVSGRSGEVAYVVNLVGAGLFGGAAFTLNMALFYLDEAAVEDLLSGPTRSALLGSAVVFAVGCVLFGVSAVRAGVWPRAAAWAYTVTLPLLALVAPKADTVLSSALHIAGGVTLMWLAVGLHASPAAGSDGAEGAAPAAVR
ncbi:hypothetical protein [Streptomyces sp. NPDC005017]|uniref:hypothetical protein n=1 Tax=Streptomyces sp. NPDC005017 TaxID=3364706 RepID=UPI003697D1EC